MKTVTDDNKRRGELIDQQKQQRDKLAHDDAVKSEEVAKLKLHIKSLEQRQHILGRSESKPEVKEPKPEPKPEPKEPRIDGSRQLLIKTKEELNIKNKALSELRNKIIELETKLADYESRNKDNLLRVQALDTKIKKLSNDLMLCDNDKTKVIVFDVVS